MTCRACGLPDCAHPDPIFAGIIPASFIRSGAPAFSLPHTGASEASDGIPTAAAGLVPAHRCETGEDFADNFSNALNAFHGSAQ